MSVIEQALHRAANRRSTFAPKSDSTPRQPDRLDSTLDHAMIVPPDAPPPGDRRYLNSRPATEGVAVLLALTAMVLAAIAVSATTNTTGEPVHREFVGADRVRQPEMPDSPGRLAPDIRSPDGNRPPSIEPHPTALSESPDVRAPTRGGQFRVSGIISGASTSYAVINGAMVSPGQTIDGASVVSIDATSVRIRMDGGEFDLRLNSDHAGRESPDRGASVDGP